jgi:hypothetical protein
MKAQEKTGPHQRKQAATKLTTKKAKADGEKNDKTAKKRTLDEMKGGEDEDDDGESDVPNDKAVSEEVRKIGGSKAGGHLEGLEDSEEEA